MCVTVKNLVLKPANISFEETAAVSVAAISALQGLLEAGKVKPVIDRRHPSSELPEAIRYLEEGHARGKVVITVEDNNKPDKALHLTDSEVHNV